MTIGHRLTSPVISTVAAGYKEILTLLIYLQIACSDKLALALREPSKRSQRPNQTKLELRS